MKIQSINSGIYPNTNVKRVKAKPQINNTPTFKGYEDVLWKNLKKNLTNRIDVALSVQDIYKSLLKESGIKKMQFFNTVHEWILNRPTYFVEELSKPTAQMRPEFRDLFFSSKEENISILKGKGDDEVYLVNFGKHGFWNFLFDSEYAKKDIRLVFSSKDGSLELGTTKKGQIYADQTYKTGYWKKNIFDKYSGLRISQETGDASAPAIW